MQKRVIIFVAMLLCSTFVQSQITKPGSNTISGIVKDSATGAPLEYATVTLIESTTSKTITGTTTNAEGAFSLTDVAGGKYKLVIEFIGYLPHTINPVSLNRKDEILTLKTIHLSKKSESLEAVTVTSKVRLVENKIDKMVFNAEKDLTSQGGVAADILKKVPQVSVDADGNVQLAGNSSIRFLINGKPSTAFGSSITDVLQSLPASQIKSIEVITNPGARYDAQGLGGIINIILKQNTAKGINGNLSLTAGTRQENGSFNFNARNKNFGFNAFVSGNARLSVKTPSSSERNSTDTFANTHTTLIQDGRTSLKRHGLESGIGFDWTYKKHNNFSGSVTYDLFGNSSGGLVNQSQVTLDNNGNTLSGIFNTNNSNNTNRFHNIDASFNYKRTFEKEDQELEFSANTSTQNSTTRANNEQRLLPMDSLYYGIQSTNPGKETETQLVLDYTQPLAENVMLGTGVKTTFLDISSNSDVLGYRPAGHYYLYDSSLSNNLKYHQRVYAAYAELSFPVAKLFDMKIGGRYERTEITSYYSNAQQQAKTPGYNTFVPSIYLSRKLGEDQVLKLAYSKRIERPDYGDLNPFVNTSDPKNISAGNPYLLPELGQRAELSYSREMGNTGSFMITAFYRHNSQDIQPYVKYYPSLQVGDSTYYNVSVSSRENIGVENNTGINLFLDVHPTTRLGLRTNVFMFHRHIINKIDDGANRTSFNYRFNLNATYQFTSLLAAEFFGNFNSARNEVQGKYPSQTTYSFAVRKQFWNKKASLALTAINPFGEYLTQRTELYGVNFNTTNIRRIPFRSVGLNFTWKFGLLEFKKEDKENDGDISPAP